VSLVWQSVGVLKVGVKIWSFSVDDDFYESEIQQWPGGYPVEVISGWL